MTNRLIKRILVKENSKVELCSCGGIMNIAHEMLRIKETRPDACDPDNCEASFHCKGSCKLNMTPGDDNPKCRLIRKIHEYFEDNGYYAD